MLVLSRKVGEKILIGDNVTITVVRVAQGTVRIGVEAPRDMPVIREEVVSHAEHARSSKIQEDSPPVAPDTPSPASF